MNMVGPEILVKDYSGCSGGCGGSLMMLEEPGGQESAEKGVQGEGMDQVGTQVGWWLEGQIC